MLACLGGSYKVMLETHSASGCYVVKRTKAELLSFKVQQAVGSMAIEDMRVSRESQAMMLQIAAGRVVVDDIKAELVAKYRQVPSAG